MIDFKGSQFEREIILWGVRWYVAYPLSYRQLGSVSKVEMAIFTLPVQRHSG